MTVSPLFDANPRDRENFIIKIICPATTGIVAAVTAFLAERRCYISEMAQFDDEENRQFFMRAVFHFTENTRDEAILKQEFAEIAQRFQMEWDLYSSRRPMRVVIMVSRHDHCLADLLYRFHKGELEMEIAAIVSNHLDLRPMAEREGIRFVYLPVTKENKIAQEKALLDIVEETEAGLVVLARYMQILSDSLCKALSGRAINIHHSFLPGFKGAKPYHQAYERGVKLIGATAHYVTPDLDEGPIIEQEVQRVDHSYSPTDLVAIGRDTETVALSKAVRYHLQHRVFLNDARTVVFR